MHVNVVSYKEITVMDSSAADYALALQLQAEFNKENSVIVDDLLECQSHVFNAPIPKNTFNSSPSGHSAAVIDTSWELVDPNPDARELFVHFNKKYFWDKLNGVEVRWSTRMTL